MKVNSDLRVLVTDDQESMRMLLRACLKTLDVTDVAEAASGFEALTVLESRPIDLVLLDCEMPEMDGVQTLQAIRAGRDYAKVPVIMVTACAKDCMVRAIAALGVNGYLLKPVSAKLLAERISIIREGVAA